MVYDKYIKLRLVKKFNKENSSLSQIALSTGIPKQTLSRWVKLYKRYGLSGLENKRAGVRQKPINEKFEELVLDIWRRGKRSAYKMRRDLKRLYKRNGNGVSERQIRRIYKKHNL